MINSIVFLNNIRIFGKQLKQIGIMTKKQKYINAFLDGYFSDKKEKYGMSYYNLLEKATKKADKKYKQYIKQTT